MSYFAQLGLAEPILRALAAKGYADPTPIQQQSIPALLEGRDLLGIAQTGTGKTAAFSLPSIHRLTADPQPRRAASCRMLVLSPTRELAAQIAENMRGYAKYLALGVQCVFGGVPVGKQARALVPGVDILVATPGRLLDLIDQRALTLRNVEIFVLDEADQMMDLGFLAALKRIAAMLPKERQSLFFSATMPKSIEQLGQQFIRNPVRVAVTPQATTAERVEQFATFANQAEKQALLTLRLREGLADGSIERALVFARTKHGADRVVRHLTTAGIEAAAIHGNKSQGQRTAALTGFRKGSTPVLVATDIAARGIDVPGVSHVFNFELPNVPEQYVHRIGRTARAGATGLAFSFVAPDEKPYLRDIEKLTGVKLTPLPLPEDFAKEASRLPLPARKLLSGGDEGRAAGGRGRGGEPRERTRDARGPRRNGGGRPREEMGGRDERAPRSSYRPEGTPERVEGDRRPGKPRAEHQPVKFAERGQRTERAGGEGARRFGGDRPAHAGGDRPAHARWPDGGRPDGQRRPEGARHDGERRPAGDRPDRARRPEGDRPERARRPEGDRPQRAQRPAQGGGPRRFGNGQGRPGGQHRNRSDAAR
ncbi:MAG: DEAD/DEAH box helicase [Sphingobium sp. 66-54]|nr:MAG: DEAD/DEAH box helicase [Sphingobium sp. 66-54]